MSLPFCLQTVVNQKGNVQVEMAQQLHIYQALQLSLIANRMQTRFDPDNKVRDSMMQCTNTSTVSTVVPL